MKHQENIIDKEVALFKIPKIFQYFPQNCNFENSRVQIEKIKNVRSRQAIKRILIAKEALFEIPRISQIFKNYNSRIRKRENGRVYLDGFRKARNSIPLARLSSALTDRSSKVMVDGT